MYNDLSVGKAKDGTIKKNIIQGVVGGAKGLHDIMTKDASQVKGGLVSQGLFGYLTLKINAQSGSHVGYELSSSKYLFERFTAYTTPLTYDTFYTIGNGEMFGSVEYLYDPYWLVRDAIFNYGSIYQGGSNE